MGLRAALQRTAIAGVIAIGLSVVALAMPVGASPVPSNPGATVVSAMSTTGYGPVLVVGGTGPLAGAPLYLITSDADGTFGCTTALAATYMGPITCTGPESDFINGVQSDEWPALTTSGWPVAGPGINPNLLGAIYHPGIGRQVTYAGHPLYLFDPPSNPFVPFGEGFLETVAPLPPWHGLWQLVSPSGQRAPGVATIETETLPNGKTAVAAEEYPNAVPGGAAITVYSFSRDHRGQSDCQWSCAVTWIPVLTTGPPQVSGGIAPRDVGAIRQPDGTYQVTYDGKPLYLYSAEQAVFTSPAGPPQTTGTVGNGNGLPGPDGGRFAIVFPS
jgi:predicted lipoprotein with Yx(FWY)xxD motif